MKGMKKDHHKIAHKIAKCLCIGHHCQDQREKTKWMKDVEELCMMPDCQVFITVLIQGATREWFSL